MPDVASFEEKEKVLAFIYDLLKANGQPIHYSMLLDEVANRFCASGDDTLKAKARFYTWINLDARFAGVGQGCWSLRITAPQRGSRQVPLLTLMHKSVEYDDSPARAVVRDDLDEETLSDKEMLEDDEHDVDSDDQDDFGDENDSPGEE